MGSDFFIYSVVGMRLDSWKLHRRGTAGQSNCEHDSSVKSCGDCGKPVMVETEIETDLLESLGLWSRRHKDRKDEVVVTLPQYRSRLRDEGMVLPRRFRVPRGNAGLTTNRKDMELSRLPDSEVVNFRDALRRKLEPVGLWSPEDFGLWRIYDYPC